MSLFIIVLLHSALETIFIFFLLRFIFPGIFSGILIKFLFSSCIFNIYVIKAWLKIIELTFCDILECNNLLISIHDVIFVLFVVNFLSKLNFYWYLGFVFHDKFAVFLFLNQVNHFLLLLHESVQPVILPPGSGLWVTETIFLPKFSISYFFLIKVFHLIANLAQEYGTFKIVFQ